MWDTIGVPQVVPIGLVPRIQIRHEISFHNPQLLDVIHNLQYVQHERTFPVMEPGTLHVGIAVHPFPKMLSVVLSSLFNVYGLPNVNLAIDDVAYGIDSRHPKILHDMPVRHPVAWDLIFVFRFRRRSNP